MPVKMKKVESLPIKKTAEELKKEKEELLSAKKELQDKVAEIEKKEAAIKQIEIEEEQEKRRETYEFLKKNKDIILKLFKHTRTSCSDEDVCNGWFTHSSGGYRCSKCALIEALDGKYDYSDDIPSFDFEISFGHFY